MADLQYLLDDLNERIDDAADAQFSEAQKIRWINHGLRAMWPKVYRTVQDSTIAIVADTYEYTIPAAVGDHALLTRVDAETEDGSGRYHRFEDYTILPVQTSKVLILDRIPAEAGATFRITSAKKLTELVATTDTYDGPPGTEELPVWYALGLAMGNGHEGRLDYTAYTTVEAQNGVDVNEIMNSSQFCFAQFELLLDRHAMPLPTQVG